MCALSLLRRLFLFIVHVADAGSPSYSPDASDVHRRAGHHKHPKRKSGRAGKFVQVEQFVLTVTCWSERIADLECMFVILLKKKN